MRTWLCVLLLPGLLWIPRMLQTVRCQPVLWGVLDETALEMAGAEESEEEEDGTVRFFFPWLEALLTWSEA